MAEPRRPDRTKRRFVQFIICLAVFGTALLIKILAPDSAESIKRVFADSIGSGLDYTTAFASVGQTISNGGHISEVWEALSTALFGDGTKETDTSADDSAGKAPNTASGGDQAAQTAVDAALSSAADTPLGTGSDTMPDIASNTITDAGAISDASPDTALDSASDIEEARRDALTNSTLAAVKAGGRAGGMGFVTQLSGWEVSLSEADALDDTPPIPFGLPLPVNVSYTAFALPFAAVTPVSGRLSSNFGYRDHPLSGKLLFHYGVDIAAPAGTGIHCFADGVVAATGVSASYGNYIKVLHDGNVSTFYAHCGKILAQEGQKVKKGDAIARVGMTGAATGPHLHLEIRQGDTILDPIKYISLEASA